MSASASVAVSTSQQNSGIKGTQEALGLTYRAGGLVTIRNTVTYAGSLTDLGWVVVLPKGWRYVSSDSVGAAGPGAYAQDLLEWIWTSVPPSPLIFHYTLSAQVDSQGTVALSTLVLSKRGTDIYSDLANPSPLNIGGLPRLHSADVNGDLRISLLELLRVIELYNTREQSVRTGVYTEMIDSEDGFAPGRTGVLLTRYHSADQDRNGQLSLQELLRVIEIFNYRRDRARTGEYHVSQGSEDGFAPGLAN